jgi:hypothetical protein
VDQREVISEKELSSSRFNFLFSQKTLPGNLSWLQRVFSSSVTHKERLSGDESSLTLESESERLAHEAKAGEVARLALGPLILLGAGGFIAGEVEVTEGGTRSGHHLL